jgi:hypothetical protein
MDVEYQVALEQRYNRYGYPDQEHPSMENQNREILGMGILGNRRTGTTCTLYIASLKY